MTRNERRVAGAAGIVFVALNLVAAFSSSQPPSYNDPIDKITRYFVDNHSQLIGAAFVQTLAAAIGLVFFVGGWRALRGAAGEGWFGATVFLVGGVVASAVAIVGTAIMTVPAWESKFLGDPGATVVRFAFDAQGMVFTGLSLAAFATVAGAAGAIFRARSLPRWVAWLGVLVAGAEIAGGLGYVRIGTYKAEVVTTFFAIMAWVLATGIVLLTTQGEATA